jgi:6-pyruvoyl-tetrahydropterin synthase
MQENLEILEPEDVVSLNNVDEEDISDLLDTLEVSYLSKVDDFVDSLVTSLNICDSAKQSLKEGLSCRVMTTRKNGWVNGKIKLSLQFTPDEPVSLKEKQKSFVSFDSSLDEIRNTVV